MSQKEYDELVLALIPLNIIAKSNMDFDAINAIEKVKDIAKEYKNK